MYYWSSLVSLVMQKVQNTEGINLQSDCKTTSREQTYPVCLHTMEKYEKVESINMRKYTE